ncbi:MAG TPA: hypothetical protein VF893_06365, partial [Candidatus Bathyarchaeia archaeon]
MWAIALISLPVTTFPLFSSISNAQVTPLALLPFFILLIVWSLPIIIKRGKLAKESLPLVLFTLIAIISCAAAYFYNIPGFKGKTVFGQEIRSLITLAIGLTFFIVTATWVQDSDRLKRSLKYITIGGLISLGWTGVQAFYIFKHYDQYPAWVREIQSWFVVFSPTFIARSGRVNGLTYEASWFAHQMVMIYLPVWIATSYYKTSVFKFRVWRLSIENILLVFGIAAFFLSSPRIGLLSFFLIILYVFTRYNLVIYRKLVDRLMTTRLFQKSASSSSTRSSASIISGLLIFSVYALFFALIFIFAVLRDWRLTLLVSKPPTPSEIVGLLTLNETASMELSNRFIFLERMVFWFTGWNVFNQFPWLGVGLGNAGFFFPKLAPAMGWSSF